MDVSEENAKELETLCRNLRMLRHKRNISIQQLSRETGVSESILKQIEQNYIPEEFDAAHLCTLCEFYAIKPYKIFLDISPL